MFEIWNKSINKIFAIIQSKKQNLRVNMQQRILAMQQWLSETKLVISHSRRKRQTVIRNITIAIKKDTLVKITICLIVKDA